ncbi:uncharacterized protein TM35_000501160 [Trypanosoma theileri]|uniref:Mucin-associated surface protein (MASP) n=1 Tax=Trypanosoma theileri TaxID=67003 RepID=A0A1X0NH27_9TRYP|nr:uncharacterized protein TM35_000501160 [Trypanosoma theileri]ORC84062.1 hypothetical protein TM35_000501160 [Trypanosoma theileri]
MAMKKMMGHVQCLLPFILYCFCGCVLANVPNPYSFMTGGVVGIPGGGVHPNNVEFQPAGIPGPAVPGRLPVNPPVGVPKGVQQKPYTDPAVPHGPCGTPGVPGAIPGSAAGTNTCSAGIPGSHHVVPSPTFPIKPPLSTTAKPLAPAQFGAAGSSGTSLSTTRDDLPSSRQGGIKAQGGHGVGQHDVSSEVNKLAKHPDESTDNTKLDSGLAHGEKELEGESGDRSKGQGRGNESQPEPAVSHSRTVQDVSIKQSSEVTQKTENTQKQPVSSESGVIRSDGNQELIKETTQGPQQDNHNTESNVAGKPSTDSHVTADSNSHPTTDASPSEITQSGLSTDDSNTLNTTSTEPNSTTDNVTTTENESTNGVNTVGASAEGNTTANTTSVTLNITSNEDSTSPTTNIIPTIPVISNNTIMPNVKGDADSSSSISSSVWVHVPLLIVVTLACILVC